MAGDWIKWVIGLADKPEVWQIAAILGRDHHEIAGRLMRVWEWAAQNIHSDPLDENGDATVNGSGSTIDEIVGLEGFAVAMAAVGWLRLNDSLTFPNFSRHNGTVAKARSLASRRQAKFRERAAPRNDSVTLRALQNRDKRIKNQRTDKRSECADLVKRACAECAEFTASPPVVPPRASAAGRGAAGHGAGASGIGSVAARLVRAIPPASGASWAALAARWLRRMRWPPGCDASYVHLVARLVVAGQVPEAACASAVEAVRLAGPSNPGGYFRCVLEDWFTRQGLAPPAPLRARKMAMAPPKRAGTPRAASSSG